MIARFALGRSGERSSDTPDSGTNISNWERAGSGVLGVALVATGLGRGTRVGTVLTLAGGWLLHRAIGGHGPLYWLLGVNTADGDT